MNTNRSTGRTDPGLTIGHLAKAAGVNVETVRYYQRIGLIREPVKPAQGYRCYPAAMVATIRFIKRAQELGFSLNEISDLLSLNAMNCDKARAIAEHKYAVIQQRIDDLNAIQRELSRLINACRKNVSGQEQCAIIATLSETTGNKSS
ncbi:MerR family transcriptional regulator [Sedimenticola hydrogenitrophicus]|uniref:MerR family transcriptional regulator n=1 Tax=Sedimenticola hydrogenitrophicus TaxID=2967975 RepID=UPI0023AE83C7|nr:MerR family DNA-binding protein [Sedimenticola hydrogenitrophicus]